MKLEIRDTFLLVAVIALLSSCASNEEEMEQESGNAPNSESRILSHPINSGLDTLTADEQADEVPLLKAQWDSAMKNHPHH